MPRQTRCETACHDRHVQPSLLAWQDARQLATTDMCSHPSLPGKMRDSLPRQTCAAIPPCLARCETACHDRHVQPSLLARQDARRLAMTDMCSHLSLPGKMRDGLPWQTCAAIPPCQARCEMACYGRHVQPSLHWQDARRLAMTDMCSHPSTGKMRNGLPRQTCAAIPPCQARCETACHDRHMQPSLCWQDARWLAMTDMCSHPSLPGKMRDGLPWQTCAAIPPLARCETACHDRHVKPSLLAWQDARQLATTDMQPSHLAWQDARRLAMTDMCSHPSLPGKMRDGLPWQTCAAIYPCQARCETACHDRHVQPSLLAWLFPTCVDRVCTSQNVMKQQVKIQVTITKPIFHL